MKRLYRETPAAILALLLMVFGTADLRSQYADQGSFYFGIEVNGALCGYAEIELSEAKHGGKDVLQLDETVFAMLTALGSTFNTHQTITYLIDPESGNFLRHSNAVTQGDTHFGGVYEVRDGAVALQTDDEEKLIDVPAGTMLPNTLLFTQVMEAFSDPSTGTVDCRQLEVRDGEVHDYTLTRIDGETLELAGKTWKVLVVDEVNHDTGMKTRMWIDRESGHLLQVVFPNRRIFRTDASVVKKIKAADLDKSILVKTNARIADVQGISSMKVHATLRPIGLRLTQEDLNGPGQSFTGTVHENAIDGVFEIRHVRYDGGAAPAFPPDYSGQEELLPYLAPSMFCESDDPALSAEAREITKGATSSWEAATRLSAWVANNIGYAIPGGGSARKTFEVREGECGAHSLLLAAMCRSVGIPARVVWGCMYTPNLGGSFGQHGWNEIYMGDAGWIPVDATAHEVDFVDSGHLRVGEMQSTTIALNADSIEILDYTLGSGEVAEADAGRLDAYLGVYSSEDVQGKKFTVLDERGTLALNIADKMTLGFNDPDENGRWVCQLAPQLHITFEMDGQNAAVAMRLLEKNRMPRKMETSADLTGVPEHLQPLLGTYVLSAPKLDFMILYQDGTLVLKEPKGAAYPLQKSEEDGYWGDVHDSRRIVFERNDDGVVHAIVATHVTRLEKQ